MAIGAGVFRAYDVRGKVGEGITTELAELLGRAFGTYIGEEGDRKVAVGRDNRLTGEELKDALVRGLVSTGCTVYDIGLSTSPALYFASAHWGLPGGVNVTGSHNPLDENGFKFVGEGARPIAGDELLEIKKIIDAGSFRSGEARRAASDQAGVPRSAEDRCQTDAAVPGRGRHRQRRRRPLRSRAVA